MAVIKKSDIGINVPPRKARNKRFICDSYLRVKLFAPSRKRITLRFSRGARSAFKLIRKRLLENHAIAPSAASVRFRATTILNSFRDNNP